MSGRRLKRQQSTISIYFEALSPRYFCCFGLCHAKTIGVFIFLFELITVIGLAAFLFIQSAKYSTAEWEHNSTLIVVAISLAFILLLASTTALLFFGVCYEKSSLILPYIFRQVLYIISIGIFVVIRPVYFCPGIPFIILQLLLLVLALGSYRYFLDMANSGCRFYISDPPLSSSRTWSHSSHSRRLLSHKSYTHHNTTSTTPKLSADAQRPATIDLC